MCWTSLRSTAIPKTKRTAYPDLVEKDPCGCKKVITRDSVTGDVTQSTVTFCDDAQEHVTEFYVEAYEKGMSLFDLP